MLCPLFPCPAAFLCLLNGALRVDWSKPPPAVNTSWWGHDKPLATTLLAAYGEGGPQNSRACGQLILEFLPDQAYVSARARRQLVAFTPCRALLHRTVVSSV